MKVIIILFELLNPNRTNIVWQCTLTLMNLGFWTFALIWSVPNFKVADKWTNYKILDNKVYFVGDWDGNFVFMSSQCVVFYDFIDMFGRFVLCSLSSCPSFIFCLLCPLCSLYRGIQWCTVQGIMACLCRTSCNPSLWRGASLLLSARSHGTGLLTFNWNLSLF